MSYLMTPEDVKKACDEAIAKDRDERKRTLRSLTVDVRGVEYVSLADVEAAHASTHAPHPGEGHVFDTRCRLCGEDGRLHVALITHGERVTIEPMP